MIGRQSIKSVLFPEKSEGGEERTNLLLGVLLVGGLPLLGEPGVEEVEEGHVDGEQADHAEHHPHNNLGGQGEVSVYILQYSMELFVSHAVFEKIAKI